MKNLFVIHGAWSSRQGFVHLEQNINYDNIDTLFQFSYDCNLETLDQIVARAKKQLADSRYPTIIVGHSLGGLIALALHDEKACNKIITLAAPLCGIGINSVVKPFVYNRAPILRDIAPKSAFIKNIHATSYMKDVHCFITTHGFNPLLLDKNDGVVTIYSQEHWLPVTAISTYIHCNHFEILQRDEVIHAVNRASK